MKAPFPWFGGKSKVAHLVWEAFGDVPNFVEPFFGSGAVLLNRPELHIKDNGHWPIETVNDKDCYLSNFWRAVAADPEGVAAAADWPVNEADLHARHRWLVGQAEFRLKMHSDPHFYDVKIAGWWLWGICQWIGGGWCSAPNWDETMRPSSRMKKTAEVQGRPHLMRDKGVHTRGDLSAGEARRPSLTGSMGVHRRTRDVSKASEWQKRPSLGKGGRGIENRGGKDRAVRSQQLPAISGSRSATGRGVHASALHQKVPMIAGLHGNAGRGIQASGLVNKIPMLSAAGGHGVGVHNRGVKYGPIYEWMFELQARLRKVRVCCGDWSRILGPSATTKIGVTGVFLDPPYSMEAGRDPSLYGQESLDVSHEAREWALAHGADPMFRIVLCGYEGEHDMPANWRSIPWKSNGGYAAAAGNTENSSRERLWLSPHCRSLEPPAQRQLFEVG